MIQPLSVNTPQLSRVLAGSVSGKVNTAPVLDAADTQTNSTGQLSSAQLMPLMLSMIMMVVTLMSKMLGGTDVAGGTDENTGGTDSTTNTTDNTGTGTDDNTTTGAGGNGGSTSGADNTNNTGGGGRTHTHKPHKGHHGKGTQGGGKAGGAGSFADVDPSTVDYTKLSEQQRASLAHLDDKASVTQERKDAAIIHLGGRAHISDKPTASGVSPTARIYNDVLNNPSGFKPEEVAIIKEYAAKERAETAKLTPDGKGFVTGKYLDLNFIDQMGKRNGISQDKLNQYKQAVNDRVAKVTDPKNPKLNQIIKDSNSEITITSDIKTLEQRSGLTRAEQAVYRLAGHAVLFSEDGNVDGTILGISYQNTNALDNQAKAGQGQDINIDPEIKALAAADQADDGTLNGSSLRRSEEMVLDKIYLEKGGVKNTDQISNDALKVGKANGRSITQIKRELASGGTQALTDLKNMAKNHTPAMLAAGATMAGAAAVCPFLGGMAAGGAAIAAGSKALKNK